MPVKEFVTALPFWKKPLGNLIMKKLVGKYAFEEAYNLEAAKMIKPVLGAIPLFLGGGLRRVAHMQEIVEKKYVDGVSMARPFIREPFIIKRIREGKADVVACVSCNRCFAAIPNMLPVQCYNKGFPAS